VVYFQRSDRLVENPQGPHEGGEYAGKGGGLLHQHVHAGVVHVPADGPGGGLEGLQVRVCHVLHLQDQRACLTRSCGAQGHVPRDCTNAVDHVHTVVEALHELALALGGGLDEELAGRDELARLGGEQLLGPQERGLVAVFALASKTEHLTLPQVLCDMGDHLLSLLEHDHPARRLQSLVLVRCVRVVHACTFQAVVLVEVRVGVDVFRVPVQVPIRVAVNDWVAVLSGLARLRTVVL